MESVSMRRLVLVISVMGSPLATSFSQVPNHGNPHPSAGDDGAMIINPNAVVTRQTAFAVPFRVHQMTDRWRVPSEVQLYVSTDQGGQWSFYQRQPVEVSQFSFRASQDGEYWFRVVTVDHTGRKHDFSDHPQLIVVVDTQLPKLELSVRRDESDQWLAHWIAEDEQLDTDSLRVQHQVRGNEIWRDVDMSEANVVHDLPPRSEGSIRWRTVAPMESGQIRVEIKDQAGNIASVTRLLSSVDKAFDRPDIESDSADWPWSGNLVKTPPSLETPATGWRMSVDQPVNVQDEENLDEPQDENESQPALPLRDTSAVGFQPQNNQRVDFSRPSISRSVVSDDQLLMSNSKHFQLDYEIDDSRHRSIGRVDLWITTDGGRSWTLYGKDSDCLSPFEVEVDREGILGFRLLVHSRNGVSCRPPRPGDLPDVWIGVDWTKPVGQITSARYGDGHLRGTLEIYWHAQDDRLHERPITIKYGDHEDGPWTTIASGLPNNGRYDWHVDRQVPTRIYLRLEIADEAGNVGLHVLDKPISSAGLAPRGRIRNVRPIHVRDQGHQAVREIYRSQTSPDKNSR